jgi:hypothetical protein
MPNLGLNATQAAAIADYLLAEPAAPPAMGLVARAKRALPPSRYRYTILAFLIGLVVSVLMGRLRHRRKTE